jgi:hydrogenase expression/formation protein HypC
MCLAVPGRLVEIVGEDESLRSGTVDFGGVRRQVSLGFVPEAKVGDYVLIHVGFALSVIDEQAARETMEALEQLGQAMEEVEAEERDRASR